MALSEAKVPCEGGWRPIDRYVLAREGEASIQHQCRQYEKPCPAKVELVRRATVVAKAYAMAAIREAVRSNVSHEVVVVKGTSTDRVTLRTEGSVYKIVICHLIEADQIRVRVIGEIER